jgi:hypothetical protein
MAGAYGGAQVLTSGTSWGDGGLAWDSKAEQELRRQRELLFGTLAEGRNLWGSGTNDLLLKNLNEGMQGNLVPYTPAVQARLFSQQADANAASEAAQMARIRSHFANSGMSGGGGELSLMLNAGQERGAANNAALADIGMRSQLENFAAQERARQETLGYLSARSAAEAPYRLAEAQARGRFEVTGVAPGGGTSVGMFSGMPTAQQAAQPGGGLASGGGSLGTSSAPIASAPVAAAPRASTSQIVGTVGSAMPGRIVQGPVGRVYLPGRNY